MTELEGTETTQADPTPGRAHRKLGLALIVVASLLTFLAIFAVWANRQLLNTDNWTDTSTELLENRVIRDQNLGRGVKVLVRRSLEPCLAST